MEVLWDRGNLLCKHSFAPLRSLDEMGAVMFYNGCVHCGMWAERAYNESRKRIENNPKG